MQVSALTRLAAHAAFQLPCRTKPWISSAGTTNNAESREAMTTRKEKNLCGSLIPALPMGEPGDPTAGMAAFSSSHLHFMYLLPRMFCSS
jgi:hypothetical protein